MSTPYEYIDLDEFDEPLNFDPFVSLIKIKLSLYKKIVIDVNNKYIFIQTAETNLDAEDDTESEIAVFTRDTKIKDVRHSLVPIEYPETSEEGVAYIYHIENWEDPKAAFHDVS